MAEVGHGLVLAVRALDIDDRDPDVRTLHETTTCFEIASPHAFRMPAIATARPPWLSPCAAATVPAGMARRRWSMDARRPKGSTDGTGRVPPGRRKYSDPPSSA